MCAVLEEDHAQIYIIGNMIIFLIVKTVCVYPLFPDGNKYLNIIICEEGRRCHLESPVLMSGAYRGLK